MADRLRIALLSLAFLACGPDHRGEAGNYCKPDGTCISEHLECVNGTTWDGIDLVEAPFCRVKEKR